MLLLRICINLFYKISRALVGPIAVMKKNGFRYVIVGGILYLLIQFYSAGDENPRNLDYAHPNPNMSSGDMAINNAIIYQDGNSAFSSDLISSMSKEELAQYSHVFYFAMNNIQNGKTHTWNFYNTHGAITPTSSFKNNYGQTCRRFKEVLKVHSIQQSIDGLACPRYAGAWCKLRPNSAPACNLGGKGGIGDWLDNAERGIRGLFK